MRLLIVRHGDPDYTIDSLTEKGVREAKYLAERLEKEKIDYMYVSPLGRAKDTAGFTLSKRGEKAEELAWLQEFEPRINRPDVTDKKTIAWDWLPQDWADVEENYLVDEWYKNPVFADSDVPQEYAYITGEFDKLLEKHGYEREGNLYKAVRPNNDTICLFCHFGLECVLLAHLFHTTPMMLWHHTCAAPTSVTTVVTEERREGTAIFRMSSFGDISHLYVKGEPPAFAARFCECYHNEGERRD